MKKFICKYAGDMEDEYCGVCDGITAAMADGETIPATQCPGFEPGDKEVANEPEESVDAEPVKEETTVENTEVKADDVPFETNEKAEPVVEEKPKKTTAKQKQTKAVKEEVKDEPMKTTKQSCIDLGEVVEIRVDSGVSFEASAGNWYKLNYGETRRVSNDTNLDAVRKDMWDRANSEVDKGVADILESINTK